MFGISLTGESLIESPYHYNLDIDRQWVACVKTLTHAEIQLFSFFI